MGWACDVQSRQFLPAARQRQAGLVRLADRRKLEELRDQWFDAPDVAAQKKICEQMQLQAFDSIPFMPIGQWYYPWAFRKDLTDFVKCAAVLFWGVRRA